jgi:DNA replication protein DnaC
MTGAAVDFVERQRRQVCTPKPGGGWLCKCGGELAGENDLICQACRDKFAAERAEQERKEWEHGVRSKCYNAFQRLPDWAHTKSDAAFAEVVKEKRLRQVLGRWKGGSSLLLVGSSGTGKSSFAIRAIRGLEEELVRACLADPRNKDAAKALSDLAYTRWTTASDIGRALSQHRLGTGDEPELVSRAVAASILVIDELGPEPARFAGEIFDIIDRRYTKNLPTVVTSGLTVPDFLARYGDAMFRRLTEKGIGFLVDLHVQRGTVGK